MPVASAPCPPDAHDFGMRGGVSGLYTLVVTRGHDPQRFRAESGADGDAAFGVRSAGLFERLFEQANLKVGQRSVHDRIVHCRMIADKLAASMTRTIVPMRRLDLDSDPDIPRLAELLRAVSRANEPLELQRIFAREMSRKREFDAYISLSVRGLQTGEYKITRMQIEQELGAAHPDPWRTWASMPVHRGGFLGQIIADEHQKVFHDLRIVDDPVVGNRLAGMGSCIATPLFDEGRALNWAVVFHRSPDAFSHEHAKDVLMRGNLIGRMTKTLVIAKELCEANERLTGQLEQIAQIQRSLLPDVTPTVPGLSIASSYLTSVESGGDYYDYFDMKDGRFGVIVADVSGHGAGAATVMAMLQTILHDLPGSMSEPARILAHTNRQLISKRIETNFVTAFFGVFDAARREFTFSNAGHHPPVLHLDGSRSAAGAPVRLVEGASSLPLGIIEDASYEQASIGIGKDQTMVLYTDGITEAFSAPPERAMFGRDGLIRSLVDCTGDPVCVIDSIHQELFEHTRSRSRADDQTIVAVKVTE